jgi:hypothetical protein
MVRIFMYHLSMVYTGGIAGYVSGIILKLDIL